MFLKINNLEEMQKYYNADLNTYYFLEDGLYLDVEFVFNLEVKSDIKARNIKADYITCWDVECQDIDVNYINCWDVECQDIDVNYIDCCNVECQDIDVNYINCWDVDCQDIKANYVECQDIKARDIKVKYFKALDIKADNIDCLIIRYHSVCVAYFNIKCWLISGVSKNAKHFCLDGKIETIGAECK